MRPYAILAPLRKPFATVVLAVLFGLDLVTLPRDNSVIAKFLGVGPTFSYCDDPVGFGRDLDHHARVEHAQRMLEPGDLVGGVAEQNLHAEGIGPQTGGLRMSIGAVSVHDAEADGDRDRLCPVVRTQLLEDALEVGLDRMG